MNTISFLPVKSPSLELKKKESETKNKSLVASTQTELSSHYYPVSFGMARISKKGLNELDGIIEKQKEKDSKYTNYSSTFRKALDPKEYEKEENFLNYKEVLKELRKDSPAAQKEFYLNPLEYDKIPPFIRTLTDRKYKEAESLVDTLRKVDEEVQEAVLCVPESGSSDSQGQFDFLVKNGHDDLAIAFIDIANKFKNGEAKENFAKRAVETSLNEIIDKPKVQKKFAKFLSTLSNDARANVVSIRKEHFEKNEIPNYNEFGAKEEKILKFLIDTSPRTVYDWTLGERVQRKESVFLDIIKHLAIKDEIKKGEVEYLVNDKYKSAIREDYKKVLLSSLKKDK